MIVVEHHHVLLVDDEKDVHAVTKLVLDNMTVYGIPLKIHSAYSAAEAKKLLATNRGADGCTVFELALIDVVMETDTAGLDLCRHIREDMGNAATQIILRTGQAGKAPERAVIDRYDIAGYVNKVEATEDRLYSLVKSGIRQSLSFAVAERYLATANGYIEMLIRSDRKEDAFLKLLTSGSDMVGRRQDGERLAGVHVHSALMVDGTWFGYGDYADLGLAQKKASELRALPATWASGSGALLRQHGQDVLVTSGENGRRVEYLARTSYVPMPSFWMASQVDQMTMFQSLLSFTVR
jgi:CheY-like chemotaxis protein